MLLDNPYFIRDVRALGRREFARLCRWLVFQSLGLAAALALLEGYPWRIPDPAVRTGLMLPLLCMTHWFSCLLAGFGAGQRVFLAEHQKQTLESVLLVSRSPWLWVPAKLLYPLYTVLLVWFAGLPFYWAVGLRSLHGFTPLAVCALLPLLAGITGLCHSLLASPESWPGSPGKRRRRPLAVWIEENLPAVWLELLLFRHTAWEVLPWALGYRAEASRVSLLGLTVTSDQLLGFQLGVLALGALGTAWSVGNPGSPVAGALGRMLRLGMLATLYGIFVAVQWPRLSPLERLFWLAALPALYFWSNRPQRGKRGRRPEDPRSEPEIRALQEWWDNPLFIRDLRALLRSDPLRKSVVRHSLEYLAIPLVLALLTLAFGPPEPRPLEAVITRTGLLCAVLGPAFLFANGLAFSSRARRLWDAEKARDTLGQLLGAPLREGELVTGRWGACLLVVAPSLLGTLLCCLIGVIQMASQYPRGLMAYLMMLLFWLAYGVALAAGAANVPVPKARAWQVLLAIPYVLGPLFYLPFSLVAIFQFEEVGWEFPATVLLAVVLYGALTWAFYAASVRNITWLRRAVETER